MFSSAIIIITNLLPFVFPCKIDKDYNALTTIILSVLILTLNAFLTGKEYKTRSMRFHDCARELTKFNDKLRSFSENYDNDKLGLLYEEYNSIIQKYDDNHKQLDFDKFMFNNDQNAGFYKKRKMFFRYWIWEYRSYYFIFMLLMFFIYLQFCKF